MSKLQPVRGTHDLLADDFRKHQEIIDVARYMSSRFGFKEIATPIFEFTDVFSRTMGELSDVVNKEMYTFEDRGGESVTLRPEFTAGVVRSLISNGLQQSLPLKFFTTGPVFRYERPQKGRQRQFHQINVEHFGATSPIDDAESIMLAAGVLENLGIGANLHINSLGDDESRKNYRDALTKYLKKHVKDLSKESKDRLVKNPLRILDSKDAGDKKITAGAPKLADYLNDASKEWFEKVKETLDYMEISYFEDSNLVRGLDYYSHTVFEFKSEGLGAQDTLLAGGRYDGLVKQMGGPDVPAVGWGAGIERLSLIADLQIEQEELNMVIAGSEELKADAMGICQLLRAQGRVAELSPQTNFSKAMKKANSAGASYAYIYGEDEAENGNITIKDLKTGEQEQISIQDFLDEH